MKIVFFLACLSVVACINTSQNYWCVKIEYIYSTPYCVKCYNSDIEDGKCNGKKIEGCTISYKGPFDAWPSCVQCDIGYHGLRNGVMGPYCGKVKQEELVTNCVGYYDFRTDKQTCVECANGFMPGLDEKGELNNTCIKSLYQGCERQGVWGWDHQQYYNCGLCSPRNWMVEKQIPNSRMTYNVCEPSPNEGCVDGSSLGHCRDLCDWRIGYEAVTNYDCAKRQEILLA